MPLRGFAYCWRASGSTHRGHSPGTFIILWHIAEAERQNVPYVYLGYWIEGSRKMAYKTRFRPAEVLCREGWRQVED